MTDLELTKACASAMAIEVWKDYEDRLWHVSTRYDPLHDEAQAMALKKRHQLSDYWLEWKQIWVVSGANRPPMIDTNGEDSDLNRAICQCVAKMHLASAQR